MSAIAAPPIGVAPRWLFSERHNWSPSDEDLAQRFRDVLMAFIRYRKAGFAPPPEWAQELKDIRCTQRVLSAMGW